MAYKQKSIIEIIEEIDKHNILLPSIQRKFIWDEDEMIKLMDSIMRGYPFGTFLFWKINKESADTYNYQMYEFIKDYNEKDGTNPTIELHPGSNEDAVISVLDGQQRLSSLYIATMGSLSLKIPKKRRNDPNAFPKKELYFNLLSAEQDDEDGLRYEFKFLSQEDFANIRNADTKCWYRVKDVLHYSNLNKTKRAAKRSGIIMNKITRANLSTLYSRLMTEKLINYYEVVSDSMDDVLDIFVRANTGGVKLSKTDLLFSTIVAQWSEARDEIDSFLKTINNRAKSYFKFDTDFIMRTCLYILDMPILMKVENFSQANIEQIRKEWANIKLATSDVISMLEEQGFSAENILSSNAILPIIYYRFKNGEQSLKNTSVKDDFRKYFVLAQMKKIFGSHSNQVLNILRDEINKLDTFSYAIIKNTTLSDEKSLACSTSDIDGWLEEYKKGPHTFLLLSLLYPENKFNQGKVYEQDHMHPFSSFKQSELRKIVLKGNRKLSEKEIKDWIDKKDTLPNLELLTDIENEEKGNMPLSKWVSLGHHDKYSPKKISYELKDFEYFYEKRKTNLNKKLKSILIG